MEYNYEYLKENVKPGKHGGTVIHNNRDVFGKLKAYNPDIVITGGFNPTMLYAFVYTLLYRKKHIPISDAWALTEQGLSPIHLMARRITYRFSPALIACSKKGKAYFESYGLGSDRIFISHYTIDNERFNRQIAFSERKYDLMFSGQFVERKNPFFFIEVARLLKLKKPGLKVLLLGDGPLKATILQALRDSEIAFDYPGYARQEDLPEYYANTRVFLFPTASDAWGVVANESLAAGTPVIATPFAGCAEELVIHGKNGYILPLEASYWADNCLFLLEHRQEWEMFSRIAVETAGHFTHLRAATAIVAASEAAMQINSRQQQ
jgi:glycosyltransferase involved in cell wall biosynthesis